jgi:hypothetical protein
MSENTPGVPDALKLPVLGREMLGVGKALEHLAFPLPHVLASNWRALWESKPMLTAQLVGNTAEVVGVGVAFSGLPLEGACIALLGRGLSMTSELFARAAYKRRHKSEAGSPVLLRTPEAVMRLGIKLFAPTPFSADVHTSEAKTGVHVAQLGELAASVAMVHNFPVAVGLYVWSRGAALRAEMSEKGKERLLRARAARHTM